MRGLPFATNMIALIDNGQPIMGIIYNFTLDEFFLAIKGQGAWCNGHPITVSGRPLGRSFVLFAGRVSEGGGCPHNELRELVGAQTRMNASGFEFSAIARGALDGAVLINSRAKPWDMAPTTLLVQEAGGRVENIDTPGSYDYRNSSQVVVGNPVNFDELARFARSL